MTSKSNAASSAIAIRPAQASDFDTIAQIYQPYVLETAITFDLEPPSPSAMRQRWQAVTATGSPYLVAEAEGHVVGYAAARPYAEKAAYAWTLEDSIYVDRAAHGKGIGSALLRTLIDASEAAGFRQMLALIAAGHSESSVALHLRHGFVQGGYFKALGYKHGHWHDVIYMQRALGQGDASPPKL